MLIASVSETLVIYVGVGHQQCEWDTSSSGTLTVSGRLIAVVGS